MNESMNDQGRYRSARKVARMTGMFPDCLDSFQLELEVTRLPGRLSNCFECFWGVSG